MNGSSKKAHSAAQSPQVRGFSLEKKNYNTFSSATFLHMHKEVIPRVTEVLPIHIVDDSVSVCFLVPASRKPPVYPPQLFVKLARAIPQLNLSLTTSKSR